MEEIKIPDILKRNDNYIDLRNVKLEKNKISQNVNIKNKNKKINKIAIKASLGIIFLSSSLALFSVPQTKNVDKKLSITNIEKEPEIIKNKKPRRVYTGPGIEEIDLEKKEQEEKEQKRINNIKLLRQLADNQEIEYVDFGGILSNEDSFIGTKKDLFNERLEKIRDFFDNTARERGVDSNILIAIAKQESNLNNNISGKATGIMQIEDVNHKSTYKSYNYNLGMEEKVSFSKLNLYNIDDNIKAGTIIFQNRIKNFDYNILFALQSYNYGEGPVNKAIEYACNDLRKDKHSLTYDEVYPYLEYIHKNPNKTIRTNWEYKTYGDPLYAKRISEFSNSRLIYNKSVDELSTRLTVYDLETGKAIKKYIKDDDNINDIYIDMDTNEKIKFENIVSSIDSYNNSKQNKR